MSEEVLHITGSQIVDVVVRGTFVTVYLLGGTSTEEMESGGTKPEMYDVSLEFAEEAHALKVRSVFFEWYTDSEPVTVVAYEDGGATIRNDRSNFSVQVTCDNGS
jgi:hypothetical protein